MASAPRNRRLVLGLAATLLLAGCQQRPLLHAYQAVDDGGWTAADTLRFRIDSLPATRLYTLSLGLRFSELQPYRDFHVVLEQRVPTAVRRDTAHLILGDSEGRWQAQGVVLHGHEVVATATQFAQGQPLDLLVYPVAQHYTLRGITEVGVKVE